MAIISSVIVEDVPQADGRRRIREQHQDQFGNLYSVIYLAPDASWDADAALAAHAAARWRDLQSIETSANLADIQVNGAKASPTLNFCALVQVLEAVAGDFQASSAGVKALEAEYLSGLTDDHLTAAFGITQAKLLALRATVFGPLAKAVAAVRAVEGL